MTTHTEPIRRPSALGWRLALIAVGALGIAALTLSDRVPALTTSGVERVHPGLGRAVNEILDLGHVTVWAIMAFAVVWLLHGGRRQALGLVGLVLTATALEAAQAFASSTRTASVHDAQANLVGIALGAVVAVVLTIDARAARRSSAP